MMDRQRQITTFLLLLAVISTLGFLVHKIHADTQQMIRTDRRLLLSTALVLDPKTNQHLAIDGDPKTAILDLNHLPFVAKMPKLPKPISNPWNFRLDRPFFQVDVGLSHLPGNPPAIHPLHSVRIWPGYQKNRETWMAYAKPRKIELIFFRQRLVDSDREYRIIGQPKLWQTFAATLENRFGFQEIPLHFRKKIPPTKGFPGKIDLIWCRLEILDYYPGKDPAHKASIALSELEFRFAEPSRSIGLAIPGRARRRF